jgi:hypothetical protein
VAPGAHLQRQDSDTYIFCLSRLPDSGMILIGSHEDRAPDAESCARPTRLVELPALLDHPDDPTGPVWSGPDRRRAPGYGADGWFLYSLPVHVPGVLGSERRLVEEGRNGLEQTMDAIARGVEIIGIVTLVLAWRRPSSAPRWA